MALCETKQERSALFVATLTSFMGPLMISAVNVALPAIQTSLKAGAVGLSWIATGYLLSIADFLVPTGKLADIHGRKKVFTAGLIINTIAAALAACVPGLSWLIAARVLQDLGAAMFVTTGMAILTSIFPPRRRGRVIGIYVAAATVVLALYLGTQPIVPQTFPVFLRSIQTCFTISALLCALGVLFSFFRGDLNPEGTA